MSYYVEYLRALRALRTVAVLLGLLLVGALIARFSWGKPNAAENSLYVMEHSATAHVTRTKLPGGRTRTVIDDRKQQLHTVVERRGDTVTSVESTRIGASRVTTISGDREKRPSKGGDAPKAGSDTVGVSFSTAFFDIGSLFAMTIPMGLLAATLLAGPLAKENNGHLELAWTKPVSRERYALSAVLVDVAAVVVAQVATTVTLLLAALFWDTPRLSFEPLDVGRVAFSLMGPIAWYACLTAFSASLKRGPGAVLGIGWVAAVACPAIAAMTHEASTPVGRSVYAVFNAVSYVDPIMFTWFRLSDVMLDPTRAIVMALVALTTLAILYLALAVVQWRRVEA